MKGFYSLFSDSAKELKSIRTLTVTGMMMALALVLRALAIQPTADIRISFEFLPIIVIAMLYGPVVGGMSSVAVDFLGYIISDAKIREYSLLLACAHIIAGVIYGLFLYRKEINSVRIVLTRVFVVLTCDFILKSVIIHLQYVNKDFNIRSISDLHNFGIWLIPRIIKSVAQLPLDILLISVIIPNVIQAYKKVRGHYIG